MTEQLQAIANRATKAQECHKAENERYLELMKALIKVLYTLERM